MPLGPFQPPKPAPGGWRREKKLKLIRTIKPTQILGLKWTDAFFPSHAS
jgi:hypothetical protein